MSFPEEASQIANQAYTNAERLKQPGDNIVLVKVDSVRNLLRAYPNLFLDTQKFSDLLQRVICLHLLRHSRIAIGSSIPSHP